MGNGISVEWLLALEKALASKNWDSESAVINYVNRISDTKLTNVSDINEAIVIISKQMKQNYPVRCFVYDNKEE